MKTFIDLLRQSVIVQALITLAITITVCTIFLRGERPPDELISAFWVILGFYFGSKIQHLVQR